MREEGKSLNPEPSTLILGCKETTATMRLSRLAERNIMAKCNALEISYN
jgi:hypothetical protein